ncbi:MAG: response regulator transcription factor, partial [Bacteroidota bacterium]
KGPEVTKLIKTEYPSIKVIGLTMHDGAKTISKMTKVGVDGYLLKNTKLEEITQAIEAVHEGQKYFKGIVLNKIIEFSNADQSVDPAELLTRRELEILKLLAQGKQTTEIADALYISIHTVNSHRKNMIKKLKLRNTAELISFSYQNELLQSEDDRLS